MFKILILLILRIKVQIHLLWLLYTERGTQLLVMPNDENSEHSTELKQLRSQECFYSISLTFIKHEYWTFINFIQIDFISENIE